MIRYKLLALDLDGTLLNNQQEISSEDRKWVKRAQEAGAVVVLATGRGRKTCEQYWDVLDPTSPVVLVNANEVWRNHNELLERHVLTQDEVEDLLSLARAHDAWFWGHVVGGVITKEDFTPQAFDVPWLNFGLKHGDASIVEHLRQLINGWNRFEVTSSSPYNLELSRKGINKATGIAMVADLLGINRSEIMAIGDSLNDLELLRCAGFGVAMGNADPRVKAVADAVTRTNDESGVSEAIQQFLLG